MAQSPSVRSSSKPQQPRSNEVVAMSQGTQTSIVSNESIAKRAYEKYAARGMVHGLDQEDWALANDELVAEHRAR
jgi:hypothetical protein